MKKKILSLSLFCFTILSSQLNAQVVTTFAGSVNKSGATNGTGTDASFNSPDGLAVDALGNVYVADQDNHLIRKITAAGVVSTFAGSGSQGAADGTGTAASFNYPAGVAVDALGNVYVADDWNNLIRKITPTGVVSTLAGSGSSGAVNGTGVAASFNGPSGIAVDASGNLYVADLGNNLIRKITVAGVVSTLAGRGGLGSFADGTGTAAGFDTPFGVAVDLSGNVYVADGANNRIRKITPSGIVSTLAGSGAQGHVDGTGAVASFSVPYNLVTDTSGNVYVTEWLDDLVRKITPDGTVSVYADNSASVCTEWLDRPQGIALDKSGIFYVADTGNNLIRKITNSVNLVFVSTSMDTSICKGSTATLHASGPDSIFWSTVNDPSTVLAEGSSFTVSPLVTTSYLVRGESICKGYLFKNDTITLTVYPSSQLNLGKDTSLCAGTSITFNVPADFVNPIWNNVSHSNSFTASQAGSYWLSAQDQYGCTDRDTVKINAIISLPEFSLGSDVLFCNPFSLNINPVYDHYFWQDGMTDAPVYYVNKPGTYAVKVVNACGQATDSILVTPIENIRIPNLITPNGDAMNDYFEIKGVSNSERGLFVVYNSWGDVVYENTQYNNEWNGETLASGIYYYYYFLSCYQNKGWVQIVR